MQHINVEHKKHKDTNTKKEAMKLEKDAIFFTQIGYPE